MFPNPVCFAGQKEGIPQEGSAGKKDPQNEVEISVFTTREEAEKLSEKIRSDGFETYFREYEAKDSKTVYGVFVIIHREPAAGMQKPPPKGSGEPGLSSEAEPPVGKKKTATDILLRSARYFHADLTVSEIYTDNAFNTRTDKKSDLYTVLSPEVWISMPGVNEKPEGLGLIDPRSGGGLSLSREGGGTAKRYQAFLLYQSDIPIHSQNSPSGNMITQNVQGGLAYNFRGGLSIAVNDEFSRNYETTDTSVLVGPGEVDQYNSNLFYAMLSYDTGNKLRFRFDYSHFLVSYDAERNSLRDRVDNSFSTYLFYKLRSKTSLFFEYVFKDIGYSNDASLNSKEHNFLLGMEWQITAKSKGSVRAGYSLRDFSDPVANSRTFVFEGNVDHKFTPKTSLTLTASRRIDESNIPSTFFVLTNAFAVRYQQMLTSKITGSLDLGYTQESYGEDLTFGGNTAKRRDNLYQATLGFQYDFRKWLKAGIYYTYATRESNFPDFNYSSNTIFFRVTGSL
ncbi:MAG: outer membrane beta-barrel protein [Thermodesulfovibrionales bacterium]